MLLVTYSRVEQQNTLPYTFWPVTSSKGVANQGCYAFVGILNHLLSFSTSTGVLSFTASGLTMPISPAKGKILYKCVTNKKKGFMIQNLLEYADYSQIGIVVFGVLLQHLAQGDWCFTQSIILLLGSYNHTFPYGLASIIHLQSVSHDRGSAAYTYRASFLKNNLALVVPASKA